MNLDFLTEKKRRLDEFRPFPVEVLENLERWFLIELTYTSNALEGNTLTRLETAVVVEKGLTVGGKSLVENLEATSHSSKGSLKRLNAASLLLSSKKEVWNVLMQ